MWKGIATSAHDLWSHPLTQVFLPSFHKCENEPSEGLDMHARPPKQQAIKLGFKSRSCSNSNVFKHALYLRVEKKNKTCLKCYDLTVSQMAQIGHIYFANFSNCLNIFITQIILRSNGIFRLKNRTFAGRIFNTRMH